MSDNPVWKVDFTHLLLGVVTLLTLVVGLGSWFYAFDASIMGALVWMLGVPILTPAVAALILLAVVIRVVAIRGVDRSLVIPLVVWAVSTWPVVWLFGIAPIAWPISIEDVDLRVDAQLPLRGDVVVGWGGDSISQNYHAFTPAQRWAYDLMYEPYNVGYEEGQLSSRLEDYGCFGKRVLSPIDGEVVFVRNGYEDQVPGKLPENPGYVMGNSVAIRWAKNTDAVVFMAHFMKGSVMVQEGQTVNLLGAAGIRGIPRSPMCISMPSLRRISPTRIYSDKWGLVCRCILNWKTAYVCRWAEMTPRLCVRRNRSLWC